MTVRLAHAGHWLESVVYLVPIVGFALWLAITTIRDRRRRRDGGAATPTVRLTPHRAAGPPGRIPRDRLPATPPSAPSTRGWTRSSASSCRRSRRARTRRGARSPRTDSPLRTPFQRDRDRIVHSKAFRRLKHKTQVFISPEGDHYRTRLTHTLEVVRDRAHGRARARAQRGPDRGDRARARPGPPAVRPHRRVRARPVPARRVRHRLPPQRALAAGRRAARARRPRAQPDRAGARRHPAPHRARTCRRRSRGGSCGWSTGSPTSTTTSTTRCAPACSVRSELPARRDRGARATRSPSASTRWCATSSSARRRPATSSRATRSAARWRRLRRFMFERVYLGDQAQSERGRIERMMKRTVRLLRAAPAGLARPGRDARPTG